MFIVDRDVDYASCLLSPVTYEALLDEVFSIRLVLQLREPPDMMSASERGVMEKLSSKY